ncbi:hypothetical protein BDW22DRAFT_844523 [Trametopsis cervina]|nr:hypothetical protein BDW22DRAFT_844523 [Trametopsis cervina]
MASHTDSLVASPRHAQRYDAMPPPPPTASKKKYSCTLCARGFTTSGHLARHARVHTGERNHKCPFPGCETKCSRQDNLQQHYRIHMSPGSRRTSGQATRLHMNKQQHALLQRGSSRRRTKSPPLALVSEDQAAPPHNPHRLPDSRGMQHMMHPIPSPPNTPPPLVDYRSSQLSQPPESISSRSSSRSSPEASYRHSPYASSSAGHASTRISHSPEAVYTAPSRSGHLSAPSYAQSSMRTWENSSIDNQEPRPSPTEAGAGYTYPGQVPSPTSPHSAPHSPYGYPGHYGMQQQQQQHGHSAQQIAASRTTVASMRDTPPPPLIQTTSYNQSYPPSSANALYPHESASSLSLATYSSSQGRGNHDAPSQVHPSSIAPSSVPSYAHHYHSAAAQPLPSSHHYTPHGTPSHSRHNSPPVVLAPIQSDRVARGAAQALPSRTSVVHSQGSSGVQQPQLTSQQQSQQHSSVPSSYPPHVQQPQPHHAHAQQHAQQQGQGYPYSSYSTLQVNGANQHHDTQHHDDWRSESYQTQNGRQPHSMSSGGLAV